MFWNSSPRFSFCLPAGFPAAWALGSRAKKVRNTGIRVSRPAIQKVEATPTVGSRKEMRKLPIIKRKEPTLRSRP